MSQPLPLLWSHQSRLRSHVNPGSRLPLGLHVPQPMPDTVPTPGPDVIPGELPPGGPEPTPPEIDEPYLPGEESPVREPGSPAPPMRIQ